MTRKHENNIIFIRGVTSDWSPEFEEANLKAAKEYSEAQRRHANESFLDEDISGDLYPEEAP